MATFADDTAIMTVGDSVEEATKKLQWAVDKVNKWTKTWLVKLNEAKLVHVDFTNKRCQHILITIKLRWKAHVKKKREDFGLEYNKIYWPMGRRSALSIHNNHMLYKQILKPVWTYGIQLWECKKQSNTDIIQRFKNKVLRNIADAPWYMRNAELHRELQMEMVTN